uniref:Uncharacterized protein n=1 Tax=Romanomermis culicivorax TaxID=13658 RepID=A0A915IJR1_ROMCU
MVLDKVQIKEESQDEEVPELESDDQEGQVMRIMEMDEESCGLATERLDKGTYSGGRNGKKTLFDIDASIVDAKHNEFQILLINNTSKGIKLPNNELIVKWKTKFVGPEFDEKIHQLQSEPQLQQQREPEFVKFVTQLAQIKRHNAESYFMG